MIAHNAFWTAVDRITDDLKQAGSDNSRRAENLSMALEAFPKEMRAHCLARLTELTSVLPAILTLCQKRDGESG